MLAARCYAGMELCWAVEWKVNPIFIFFRLLVGNISTYIIDNWFDSDMIWSFFVEPLTLSLSLQNVKRSKNVYSSSRPSKSFDFNGNVTFYYLTIFYSVIGLNSLHFYTFFFLNNSLRLQTVVIAIGADESRERRVLAFGTTIKFSSL